MRYILVKSVKAFDRELVYEVVLRSERALVVGSDSFSGFDMAVYFYLEIGEILHLGYSNILTR